MQTFSFYIILPQSKDSLYLDLDFNRKNSTVSVPWSPDDTPETWKKGYCVADNLQLVKEILEQFVSKGEGRKVKEIQQLNNTVK